METADVARRPSAVSVLHEPWSRPERLDTGEGVISRVGVATFRATFTATSTMPLSLSAGAPTLLIRKSAFERVALTRATLDARLNLTEDEFRVEGALVAIGPLVGDTALTALIEELEGMGLEYFEDFFEMSGNWPEWLSLHVLAR